MMGTSIMMSVNIASSAANNTRNDRNDRTLIFCKICLYSLSIFLSLKVRCIRRSLEPILDGVNISSLTRSGRESRPSRAGMSHMNQYSHDVCITDFEQHHAELAKLIQGFPFLTIAATHLRKTGMFIKDKLNVAFAHDIAIPQGMVEPSSYYPFSENDSQGVIVGISSADQD